MGKAAKAAPSVAKSKNGNSKAAVADASASSGAGGRFAGLVALVAAAVGLLLAVRPGAGPSSSAGAVKASGAVFASGGLLGQFTKEHNASLLWGTYRPGVLFGVKSRTFPEAVVAGLMWASASDKGRVNGAKLRHTCEESESRDGLIFGFSEHDGSTYGKQLITDPGHGLRLQTWFLKEGSDSWVMRVAGNSSKGKKVLYFYLGVDKEFSERRADASQRDGGQLLTKRLEQATDPVVIEGSTEQLGKFTLTTVPSRGSSRGVVAWAPPSGTAVAAVKDALLAGLSQGQPDSAERKFHLLPPSQDPTSGEVVVLQLVVEGSFEVDFVFAGQGSPGGAAGTALRSGERLSAALQQRSSAFRERFEDVFALRKGKFSEEQIEFAQASMSAMLGGLGYFYGSSKVKVSQDEHIQTPPKPLFTAVPSRSFFPRGFLWDEGFHQLLVGRWDAALSRDVLAHWFGLMHADGWIPREQILGAEAVAKVPDWALAQHRTHANPPTFLLAVESLLERGRADDGTVDAETAAWIAALFPALERWFQWFLNTQEGSTPGSFRWRGRDANDGKLNAMTLSSGLDDYPRASAVSDDERHVDLHSWLALGAGVLARSAEDANAPVETVKRYQDMRTRLLVSLDELHWDEERQRYLDYGLHSNDGKYVSHIVVKCGTSDGAHSVEHMLTPEHYQKMQQRQQGPPPCPKEHPQFMFPLGDGKGGLMTREKFVPKTERLQFVDHTGYVSLFPFLLRLVSPQSPKLGEILRLVGDKEVGMWSDYGLRSLGAKDKMYLRDNAPGDAPYWRGPIWMNCNFLAVSALRHYARSDGPYREQAAELLSRLTQNLVTNVFENYRRTGYLWEQYNQNDGVGQRTHPFNGWSSLVVLIMA